MVPGHFDLLRVGNPKTTFPQKEFSSYSFLEPAPLGPAPLGSVINFIIFHQSNNMKCVTLHAGQLYQAGRKLS